MDPLSDVFMAMRVKTSNCVRLEFSAPWGFRFDDYEHAHFGVVARGRCWISLVDSSKLLPLTEGDCWLLPRGDAHSARPAYDKGTALLRRRFPKGKRSRLLRRDWRLCGHHHRQFHV